MAEPPIFFLDPNRAAKFLQPFALLGAEKVRGDGSSRHLAEQSTEQSTEELAEQLTDQLMGVWRCVSGGV